MDIDAEFTTFFQFAVCFVRTTSSAWVGGIATLSQSRVSDQDTTQAAFENHRTNADLENQAGGNPDKTKKKEHTDKSDKTDEHGKTDKKGKPGKKA